MIVTMTVMTIIIIVMFHGDDSMTDNDTYSEYDANGGEDDGVTMVMFVSNNMHLSAHMTT